jgi:hypothetical protein
MISEKFGTCSGDRYLQLCCLPRQLVLFLKIYRKLDDNLKQNKTDFIFRNEGIKKIPILPSFCFVKKNPCKIAGTVLVEEIVHYIT